MKDELDIVIYTLDGKVITGNEILAWEQSNQQWVDAQNAINVTIDLDKYHPLLTVDYKCA